MQNTEFIKKVNIFSHTLLTSICTNILSEIIGIENAITQVLKELKNLKTKNNILYIIGNGGSAAVASHALVDFINVGKIHTQVLHESSLVTCMANDYGYENTYAKVLLTFMKPNDMLIAISSSGKSLNICNAAKTAINIGAKVITLTGFHPNNPLRQLGDINFWLNSNDYGCVEVGHQFILHDLSDRLNPIYEKTILNHQQLATSS